jgi:methyl-accepting chemotaxis protein
MTADQAGRDKILTDQTKWYQHIEDNARLEIANSVREMSGAAGSVTESMRRIAAVVDENTASTDEMAAQSGQVSRAIHSIASVSQDQANSADEVSATGDEMLSQVNEMSAHTQQLAVTADELKRLVVRFRVESGAPVSVVDTTSPIRKAA